MYILNTTFIVYIILYRTIMPAGYIIIIVTKTQYLNILRSIYNLNVKPIYIIYFKLNVLW